jgi:hypothetical protein
MVHNVNGSDTPAPGDNSLQERLVDIDGSSSGVGSGSGEGEGYQQQEQDKNKIIPPVSSNSINAVEDGGGSGGYSNPNYANNNAAGGSGGGSGPQDTYFSDETVQIPYQDSMVRKWSRAS